MNEYEKLQEMLHDFAKSGRDGTVNTLAQDFANILRITENINATNKFSVQSARDYASFISTIASIQGNIA